MPNARLTFFAAAPTTIAVVLIARLRLLLFLASMWFPNARPRVNLPVLVTLIRFAVALWVFNLGIIYSLLLCSDYVQPSEVFVQLLSLLQAEILFDRSFRIQVLGEPFLVLGKK